MSIGCDSYCEHGGICILESGHAGLHDSNYCQWDDAHALSESEADAVISAMPGGSAYLSLKTIVQAFAPEANI